MDRQRIIEEAVPHRNADVARLLLNGNGTEDMRLVAQQIEGWRTACEKWPSLARNDAVWYPPRLNREQSSSETAARYKALRLLHKGIRLADLTGGMGIDSIAAAEGGATVDYAEQDADLCRGMEYNIGVLGITNCRCHCCDSMAWIATQENTYDIIYIDPARRNKEGQRVAAFEDCTPNLLLHLDTIMHHCHRMVVKASPMIDLATAEQQLARYLTEVHIVAIAGECKEVLFVCDKQPANNVATCCIDLSGPLTATYCDTHSFRFSHADEATAQATYCTTAARYLYEPHAALMKGGPFKSLSQRYGIDKLSRNTHLYTADTLIDQWPGRVFEIVQEVQLSAKAIHKLLPNTQAHVVARNYPTAAATLQRQLKLREGGDHFVIATTIGSKKTGLLCLRVQ